MNRRRFLELLGVGVASTGIVYSFPSIVVPQNIASGLTLLDCVPESPSFPIIIGDSSPALWIDLYSQQLTQVKDWLALKAPLWTALKDSAVPKHRLL